MKQTRAFPAAEAAIVVAVFACFVFLGLLNEGRRQSATAAFDSYSSFDYRPGGYRAWSELLRREGVSTQPFERRPAYLNGAVAVLIVANSSSDAVALAQAGKSVGGFAAGDYAQLRNWVAAGGRLVWLLDGSAAEPQNSSRLLSRNTSADETTPLGFPPVARAHSHGRESLGLVPSAFTEGVTTIAAQSALRIPFDESARVTPIAADSGGVLAGWYQIGKGSVLVITDESLFQNSRLRLAGNARFAYNIAAAGLRPGATVAFDEWSHGFQNGDTWWTILPRNVRFGLVLAIGTIVLWLAGGLIRFGPAIRPPADTERSSDEYLTSVAWLMQRGDAARKAVRDLAELCRQDLAHALGLPAGTTATALALRLDGGERGERAALALMELDRISGYEKPSASELIRAADICISLRKEHASHGHTRLGARRPHLRRSA
ncbi:MAG: DUF4350 domain-containing protein [Candidatus Eremiobacter antarcticus]|nr:DUF4350 domain-containing protein [Candidatus Eremiobacteraeota bacterium]MBC5807347.1 DUF4350 domain-containing protein [Candidatus Eremiobacteraeota bacterium]